jgi:hypothetical protein
MKLRVILLSCFLALIIAQPGCPPCEATEVCCEGLLGNWLCCPNPQDFLKENRIVALPSYDDLKECLGDVKVFGSDAYEVIKLYMQGKKDEAAEMIKKVNKDGMEMYEACKKVFFETK